MRPQFVQWAAGAAVALSLYGPVSIAQAASLSPTQIQAIVSLLQSFGADPSVVANVQATLSGQGNTGTTSSCLNLTYDLYAGETDAQTDGQVSQLQSFLGVSPTGYFGPLTLSAVQNWQASRGIVSSGSADTTGYGFVGPRTIAAMGCGSTVASPSQPVAPVQPTQPITSTSPTAMINQESLTSTSATPTITGTATQVSGSVMVVIANQNGYAGSGFLAPASNGAWSGTVSSSFPIPNGTYSVSVYDGSSGPLLTTGMLTVEVPTASQPSATIDQASLNSTSNEPNTLSGNASNLASVQITLDGVRYSSTQVINGRWSQTIISSLQNGSHTVVVENPISGQSLATGILTIGAPGTAVSPTSNTSSATISGTPLSSNDPTPTIFGSATNLSIVEVAITGNGVSFSQDASVIGGAWSVTSSESLVAGSYTVSVYNGTNLLTSAPLTIALPTATIDPASLTSSSNNPTLTGTAANTSSVYLNTVSAAGNNQSLKYSTSYVTNGKWSASAVVSPNVLATGTYTVNVYSSDTNRLLTSGQLIVNTAAQQSAYSNTQSSIIAGIDNIYQVLTSGNVTQIRALLEVFGTAPFPATTTLNASDATILSLATESSLQYPTDAQLRATTTQWSETSPTMYLISWQGQSGTQSISAVYVNGQWY
jgi:hypothetical protein